MNTHINCSDGKKLYSLLKELFPVGRSITGNGVRHTLARIKKIIPLKVREVKTGTRAFDWKVPREWNIRCAYIEDEKGRRVVDYKNNTLHIVGYSVPVDKRIPLEELQQHLYSLPDQPDAIPYMTSYYEERWGFCLADRVRKKLKKGMYRVVIDSELKNGSLTYGEYIIPGKTSEEVLLSTYICHPSLANDNLSGIAVTSFLAKWVGCKPRRYTYRFVFIPETIGALVYLSKNLKTMKKRTIAGYVLSCVGDGRGYAYLPSRKGDTLSDTIALHILNHAHPGFKRYSYAERGSDERQYCSPGIDLPVASLMRSKYGTYPEYHTSLDNLDVVSPDGLQGALDLYKESIELLERNDRYRSTCLGEPQLGRRNLYPTLSGDEANSEAYRDTRQLWQFLAYADGKNDLIDIAENLGVLASDLYPIVDTLEAAKLIVKCTS